MIVNRIRGTGFKGSSYLITNERDGRSMTQGEWAKELGIHQSTLSEKLNRWDIEHICLGQDRNANSYKWVDGCTPGLLSTAWRTTNNDWLGLEPRLGRPL